MTNTIRVTTMDMNELRKKYWNLDTNSCTFEQFLNAVFEAREMGYQLAKEIYESRDR